jgi:hypothetical protein
MACCCRNEQWPSLPLLSWTRRLSCSSSTASQKPDGYGKLQMELEWLKKSLSSSDARELRQLVDHDHPELTVSRQCELLVSPAPPSAGGLRAADLAAGTTLSHPRIAVVVQAGACCEAAPCELRMGRVAACRAAPHRLTCGGCPSPASRIPWATLLPSTASTPRRRDGGCGSLRCTSWRLPTVISPLLRNGCWRSS